MMKNKEFKLIEKEREIQALRKQIAILIKELETAKQPRIVYDNLPL